MEKSVLNVLVCPLCKSPLIYDRDNQRMICKADKLAYPIKDGVPVMLVEEAKSLSLEEVKQYG